MHVVQSRNHQGVWRTCKEKVNNSVPYHAILQLFKRLMDICREFCTFSFSYTRYKGRYASQMGETPAETGIPTNLMHSSHPSAPPESISDKYIAATGGSVLSTDQAEATLMRMEGQFLHDARKLMDTLKYYSVADEALFANVAAKMDYNLYYARLPPDLSIIVEAPQSLAEDGRADRIHRS